MICENLSDLLGYACHPLNEDGSIAFIETAFAFSDGDGLPVFVEKAGSQIRFFDDNETVLHFLGRGMGDAEGGMRTRFIKNAIAPFGLVLNDENVVEIWADMNDSQDAFAKFVGGLMSVAQWERENEGTDPDSYYLVEEVAMHLSAWKGQDHVTSGPKFTGLSKTEYTLDFLVDGEAVIAIKPNAISVGSALKKMVDIAGKDPRTSFRVIIEDRTNAEAASTQGVILSTMATVMPMTKLIEVSRAPATVN